eukprot:13271981-Alexandrium_andersonii.AAC.1
MNSSRERVGCRLGSHAPRLATSTQRPQSRGARARAWRNSPEKSPGRPPGGYVRRMSWRGEGLGARHTSSAPPARRPCWWYW